MNTTSIHSEELIKRIDWILEAKEKWLNNANNLLQNAIHKTIALGFEKSDIYHAIKWISSELNRENIEKWCSLVEVVPEKQKFSKSLFLHAGNLPLVGFQDVIAAILSGTQYYGKLSKKEPYLLKSFLDIINEISTSLNLHYSTSLEAFENMNADRLIFSGSEQSTKDVLTRLKHLNALKESSKKLIRTAHFSIAVFNRNRSQDWEDLAESIFRYNGLGCRSVSIIISTEPLKIQNSCSLTDFSESWFLKQGRRIQSLTPTQLYYKAYYESVDIPVLVWGDKLIVETTPGRMIPGIIYWIKGNESERLQIISKYAYQIQTIYHTDAFSNEEPLYKAQFPDLNWKPDGEDLLNFLSE